MPVAVNVGCAIANEEYIVIADKIESNFFFIILLLNWVLLALVLMILRLFPLFTIVQEFN